MGWIYELAGLWVDFLGNWAGQVGDIWEQAGQVGDLPPLGRWLRFFLRRRREALNAAVTRSQTHPSFPQ